MYVCVHTHSYRSEQDTRNSGSGFQFKSVKSESLRIASVSQSCVQRQRSGVCVWRKVFLAGRNKRLIYLSWFCSIRLPADGVHTHVEEPLSPLRLPF